MTFRTTTHVLPGNRIEVATPELKEGETVEVYIVRSEPTRRSGSFLDYLRSLPPSKKTPEEWEQFEKDFQAERDAWDR